jgi:hypothetical protein
MASRAKITITVGSSRGASTIAVSSKGRYVSTDVNGFQRELTGQPIQPTSTQAAFWLAVLNTVVNNLMDSPTPP